MSKIEYFLHWWGGCKPYVKEKYGFEDEMYFNTEVERADAISKIRKLGDIHGWAFSTKDGVMTHKRPVANVTLRNNGVDFNLVDDSYSQEYEEHLLRFMWEDGNYACDCNRSLLLIEAGYGIPELTCGDTIELVDLHITHVDGQKCDNTATMS